MADHHHTYVFSGCNTNYPVIRQFIEKLWHPDSFANGMLWISCVKILGNQVISCTVQYHYIHSTSHGAPLNVVDLDRCQTFMLDIITTFWMKIKQDLPWNINQKKTLSRLLLELSFMNTSRNSTMIPSTMILSGRAKFRLNKKCWRTVLSKTHSYL